MKRIVSFLLATILFISLVPFEVLPKIPTVKAEELKIENIFYSVLNNEPTGLEAKTISKVNLIVDNTITVGSLIPMDISVDYEIEPANANNDIFCRLYNWFVSADGINFTRCEQGSRFETGMYYALKAYAGDDYGTDENTVWLLNGEPLAPKSVYWEEVSAQVTVDFLSDRILCVGEHVYSGTNNSVCDICGYVREIDYLFEYEISNGEVTIAYLDPSTAGEIIIPSTIKGYPVTGIGDGAFMACLYVTDIKMPEDIKTIGKFAFTSCISLESLEIPESVVSIGENAFQDCRGLTSMTIPDSVIEMDEMVFNSCSELKSVTIGKGLTNLGEYPFISCNKLEEIIVKEDNSNFSSLDGVLFNKDKTELICCPGGKTGSYTIPIGVEKIGKNAFSNCKKLTNVIISDSVTEIGEYAFANCSDLTSVTIPDSITSIGELAFHYSDNVADVWYKGREADRMNIAIGSWNDYLLNATWHYETCDGKQDHDFGDDIICDDCGFRKIIIGDSDGNGVLTEDDITAISQYLCGYKGVEIYIKNADVNKDSKIDIGDVVLLKLKLAGYNIVTE